MTAAEMTARDMTAPDAFASIRPAARRRPGLPVRPGRGPALPDAAPASLRTSAVTPAVTPVLMAVLMAVLLAGATVLSALPLHAESAGRTPGAPATAGAGLPEPRAVAVPDAVRDLARALRMADILDVMREEGLAYGRELEKEMFPGDGGDGWQRRVDAVYDRARMEEVFMQTLAREVEGADMGPVVAFFETDTGRRILELEIAARRAMLEPEVEAASLRRLEEMRAADAPRLGLIEAFSDANDMVDMNVAGAMNANVAFTRGLRDGGGIPFDMPDDQIVADVWAQEAAIRADTGEWVESFLLMAYDPLGDDDLRAYIAFSETWHGQRLNTALFAAFDAMFEGISRDLGKGAARYLAGEEI